MNLFFKRLTGKLKSTEKYEQQVNQLLADAKRYYQVESSAEMKEYLELEKQINEARFQAKKKEYLTKKYKDTVEYKNYTDFVKLQKDKTVRQYMEAVNDEEREKYSGAIVVKNYLQLKDIVEEQGFETRRLFWADPKRYNQTEEYKVEARYEELKKSDDIRFFLSAPKKEIEAIQLWQKTFNAPFHEPSLEKNLFQTGFWFKQKSLKRDFSYIEEAQAYLGEKNINIQNDVLSIVTTKGAVEAPAWDAKRGFVNHEFAYSSANINTGDTFAQEEGKFVVKVRATGKCHSAVYLVGEDRFPVIEMYHFNGKHIVVGYTDKNGRNEETLKSLPASEWQIMSVEVSRYEIVWYVNNLEVFRTKNPLPGQKLHFTAQSFAPANKGAEGQLDIDFVQAFTK